MQLSAERLAQVLRARAPQKATEIFHGLGVRQFGSAPQTGFWLHPWDLKLAYPLAHFLWCLIPWMRVGGGGGGGCRHDARLPVGCFRIKGMLKLSGWRLLCLTGMAVVAFFFSPPGKCRKEGSPDIGVPRLSIPTSENRVPCCKTPPGVVCLSLGLHLGRRRTRARLIFFW